MIKKENKNRASYFTYDNNGNLQKSVEKIDNKNNKVHTYKYDEYGRMIQDCNSYGDSIEYEYSTLFMKPSIITKRNGQKEYYDYDSQGNCIKKRDALGEEYYSYDNMGNMIMKKDGLGNITRNYYNIYGSVTKQIMPNQYEKDGENGLGYVFCYDRMDDLCKAISPLGEIIRIKRNSARNIEKEIAPNYYDENKDDGVGICYEYDKDNNRIKTINPDGKIARVFYDSCGNVVKKVGFGKYIANEDNGDGFIYKYDEMNNLTFIFGPDNKLLTGISYDKAGRIIKVISAKGFDKTPIDSERPATYITYDNLGNILSVREYIQDETNDERFYRLTKYEYDLEGRPIKEIEYLDYQTLLSSDGRVRYINTDYDKSGRIVKVSDSVGACISYEYDEADNIIKETRKVNTTCNMWKKYEYDASKRIIKVISCADRRKNDNATSQLFITYDRNGNVISLKNKLGNEIRRTYDECDRNISEERISADGKISSKTVYEYDKSGNIVSEKEDNYNARKYSYDVFDNQIIYVDEASNMSFYYYDANGNIIKNVEPNELYKIDKKLTKENDEKYIELKNKYLNTDNKKLYDYLENKTVGTRYEYDLYNRLIKTTGPDGVDINNLFYNEYGELVKQIDALGSGITIDYDFSGRRKQVTSSQGLFERYSKDPSGNLTEVISGNSKNVNDTIFNNDANSIANDYDKEDVYRTKFELDDWGRIVQVTNPLGKIEKYEYDFAGNVVSAIRPSGSKVSYFYNEINKLSQIEYQDGEKEYIYYDEEANISEVIDRNGNTIQYTSNFFGNPTSIKENSDGKRKDFEYFSDGRLKSAISDGMLYEYEYDKAGRLLRKKASGKTLIEYSYDCMNNIKIQKDITGKNTSYKYDLYGRVEKVYDNNKLIASYEYNKDGTKKRLLVGEKQDIITTYEYDLDKNLTKLKTVAGEDIIVDNTYEYDIYGRMIKKTTLTGAQEYSYNKNHMLTQTAYPTYKECFYYDYDGNRIKKEVYGSKNMFTENINQEVYGSKNIFAENINQEFNKTSDVLGSKESFKSLINNKSLLNNNALLTEIENYQYDIAGRLIQRKLTKFGLEEKYDKLDEILDNKNKGNISNINNIKNTQDIENITKRESLYNYTYDKNGNTLSDGEFDYNYNGFNQMVSAISKDKQKIQKCRYDAQGLRCEIKENEELVRFIYNDNEPIIESNNKDIIRYIRTDTLISSDSLKAKTYYHYSSDERGSITNILDKDGKVKNSYQYDAFGNIVQEYETVLNRFKYTGQQLDTITGQYYLRARYYNPIIARFTQEDTYHNDGLNLYTYVRNNPLMYIDHTGHFGQNPMKCQETLEVMDYLRGEGIYENDIKNVYNTLREKHKDLDISTFKDKVLSGEIDYVKDACTNMNAIKHIKDYYHFSYLESVKEYYRIRNLNFAKNGPDKYINMTYDEYNKEILTFKTCLYGNKFDPNGEETQQGVDPFTVFSNKSDGFKNLDKNHLKEVSDLVNLDINSSERIDNSNKSNAIIIYKDGIISNGHHRVCIAQEKRCAIDINKDSMTSEERQKQADAMAKKIREQYMNH